MLPSSCSNLLALNRALRPPDGLGLDLRGCGSSSVRGVICTFGTTDRMFAKHARPSPTIASGRRMDWKEVAWMLRRAKRVKTKESRARSSLPVRLSGDSGSTVTVSGLRYALFCFD